MIPAAVRHHVDTTWHQMFGQLAKDEHVSIDPTEIIIGIEIPHPPEENKFERVLQLTLISSMKRVDLTCPVSSGQ